LIDRASLVRLYRGERRVLEIPNFLREDLGSVVRYSPAQPNVDGVVCFTSLASCEVDDAIRRHVAHFRALGTGFEWKVYGSDEPQSLREGLLEAGFEEGSPELLMVYDVGRFRPASREARDGIEIRRIVDGAALAQFVDLQERIWNRSFEWLLDQLRSTFERSSFYGAYDEDRLVGTGWIEYPGGSQFAELHGGAVLPQWRGRGIYSRLFESRMIDAYDQRVPWVAVDAAPLSRPILEAKGFAKLDTTYPMVYARGLA
jgi:hypothetical protein